MSLICGIFARHDGWKIPNPWMNALRSGIDRDGVGVVAEHADSRLFLLKLDIGAFDTEAWSTTGRSVAALAGDSVLDGGARLRTRAADLIELADAGATQLATRLRRTRGYFNFVRYDLVDQKLVLATDRVGLRPMYVYEGADFLVFSGALRLIEALPGLALSLDLRGTLETACFGYPLGNRTRYKEVRCLPGGGLVRADAHGVRDERYWRIDHDACDRVSNGIEGTLDELYAQFSMAVRLRSGKRKAVFSALSGGLDSRCVTAELWRQGLEVHAVNVSWKGSYDDVLGEAMARALGIAYHHADRPPEEYGNSLAGRLADFIKTNASHCADLPSTPLQSWSGNGGSMGMGHTHMTSAVGERLRSGDVEGAARIYREQDKLTLSGKVVAKGLSSWVQQLPQASIVEELSQIRCHDPARAMYVFQLENAQRRILSFHMEQVDRVRMEFIEPFFDPEVLSVVCRLPMDFCLRHQMYHRWLERLPAEVRQVAWQVYPGHEPCPVKAPDGLFTQWEARPGVRLRTRVARTARPAADFLLHGKPYSGVLSAHRVAAAYVARGLGLVDTSHLIRQAELLRETMDRCQGRVAWPDDA